MMMFLLLLMGVGDDLSTKEILFSSIGEIDRHGDLGGVGILSCGEGVAFSSFFFGES